MDSWLISNLRMSNVLVKLLKKNAFFLGQLHQLAFHGRYLKGSANISRPDMPSKILTSIIQYSVTILLMFPLSLSLSNLPEAT